MRTPFFRPFLLAALLLAAPAAAGTSIQWRGAGWYLWMSGTENGQGFNVPIDGAFADQSICLARREEWIANIRNRGQPVTYQYNCYHYAQPWTMN